MVNFNGVGSGIDFGAITEQLVRLERLPAAAIETRKAGTDRQISLLGDLATRLRALETAATNLDAPSKVRAVKATTADEDRVKISASGEAQLGTFDVTVSALARAQTNQSRTFASDTAGVLGMGSMEISVGTADPINITWDSDDNLTTLARRINDASAGVRASVLRDGTTFRLLVSAEDTGAANTVNYDEVSNVLGFGDLTSQLTSASDAALTVAGVPVTRASNTLTDVIDGVTFELVSVTPVGEPATTVRVDRDPEGLAAKVQTFVDAVNAVQSFVAGQLGSKTASNGESLRGDSTLQAFQRQMSTILGGAHGPDAASLGRFGVKLASDGSLTLDKTKLESVAAEDPEGLSRLLAGTSSNGLISALSTMSTEYTRSGDGILAAKQSTLRSRISAFDQQIERVERNATSLEERLRRQFTATDTTIALLNSQSSYINSMLYR
jgi:flagellar hook-associated protein 2